MIPTKTSLVASHSSFDTFGGDMMCCQVPLVLWREVSEHLVFRVGCLSICSLWFILCSYRDSIACGVVVLPPMTRLQHSTQMRCAASDIRIWRSRDAFLLVGFLGRPISACWGSRERDLQPRIVPMVTLGQGPKVVTGQMLAVVRQMVVRSGLLQVSRTCSRDSVSSLHSIQCARCS
jgi:hypothetical protein